MKTPDDKIIELVRVVRARLLFVELAGQEPETNGTI
jgi:hypothetical protein